MPRYVKVTKVKSFIRLITVILLTQEEWPLRPGPDRAVYLGQSICAYWNLIALQAWLMLNVLRKNDSQIDWAFYFQMVD